MLMAAFQTLGKKMSRANRSSKKSSIFFGCEGESEQSYGKFLNALAKKMHLRVHISTFVASPAGDAFAVIQKSIRECKIRSGNRDIFKAKIVLLDSDTLSQIKSEKKDKMYKMIKESEFIAIWQSPNHEGFLLTHFEGHQNSSPSKRDSEIMLKKVWPEYKKNMPAGKIEKALDIDKVIRASSVNESFVKILKIIGVVDRYGRKKRI